MLPASNRGAGQNIGFPDVCNTPTPPVTTPIPYPNNAMNALATPFSPVVKASMVNALSMISKIPMTEGDEAGVAHATIKGSGSYTMGNPIVSIDGSPGINLACPSTGNNMNNALGAALVPSAVNVFYTLRSDVDDLATEADIAVEQLVGGVVQVRIERFVERTPQQVEATVRAPGLRAVIIDLRGCPGGDMDAATRMAATFLPKESCIGELVEVNGELTRLVTKRSPRCSLPLVIVVDGQTASAAELWTAAMQDSRRALVVGSASYGKRSAYRLVVDPEGSSRLGTIGKWRRSNGAAPRRVVPDVPAPQDALRQAWALALGLAQLSDESSAAAGA